MNTIDDLTDGIVEFLQSDNERAAVIFSFSMLEQFVSDLLKIKCKHPNVYKNFSVYHKVNMLHELEVISDNEYESINWLRGIRNDAAHKPGYKVDVSGIQKRWIMEIPDMSLLQNYLLTTVAGFWNTHSELRDFYKV